MTKRFVCILLIVLGLIASSAASGYGMDRCGTDHCCCSPFGGYCKGSAWGWYGARRVVKTSDEAQKIITNFFLPEKVSIGTMKEKPAFFEAQVKDKHNTVIDTVIVDKNSGRIRSIY